MIARRGARRFGTPAYQASLPGAPKQPPRRYSQAELRQRRRVGLSAGRYSGTFSLATELAELCEPLAERIAAAERPARFRHSATSASVPILAEAVHELVGVVVGWIAERDAYAKTAHLAADAGKRKYAVTTLVDLAARPALPDITDDMLADGSWSAALVELAGDVDAALADMLGQSWPPGAPALRGQPSRSERLHALLGRTIDRAALALERRLDRDEHQPTPSTPTADPDPRAELAALGITTD